jgi:hypothetical protein
VQVNVVFGLELATFNKKFVGIEKLETSKIIEPPFERIFPAPSAVAEPTVTVPGVVVDPEIDPSTNP